MNLIGKISIVELNFIYLSIYLYFSHKQPQTRFSNIANYFNNNLLLYESRIVGNFMVLQEKGGNHLNFHLFSLFILSLCIEKHQVLLR